MKPLFFLLAFAVQLTWAQQIKFYHTFGSGIYDSGEGVLQSLDTGYVVGGITTQTGSNGTDMLIYKTDSLGVLQWYKGVGLNNCIEGAKSITGGISGSGYLLAGYQNKFDTSGYNFYAAKTDLNGDTLWTRAYGGSDWDMAFSADTLQDSTYVLAGETFSFGNGNLDMYVIRINQMGDTLWTRTFGGTNDDYARYVFVDRHNNIMVVGSTTSFGAGGSDMYMVYLNSGGDTLWTKTYGTSIDEYGYSGSMYLNNSNLMYFAFGFTRYEVFKGAQDAKLMRIDSTGTTVISEQNVFGVTGPLYDKIRIRQGETGRVYHAGERRNFYTNLPDMYMNYTFYGLTFGTVEQYITASEADWVRDIRRCFDKGFVLTGETKSYGPGPSASFILRTDSVFATVSTPVVAIEELEQEKFSIYPNPVEQGVCFVEAEFPVQRVILYDMHGRMMQSITGQNHFSQQLQLNPCPNGMYILEVITTHGVGRKKIIISN